MFSFWKSNENGEEKNGKLKVWIIVIGAVVGIALILLGGSGARDAPMEEQGTVYTPSEDEMVLYQGYLEERVKALCESVEGVGNVTAIVTLSGGFESVYATELIDGNEEYVIIGNGSSATALFLSRKAPEIAGVGIVCHGGASANARQELISLVSATFHIPTNRIYVTQA